MNRSGVAWGLTRLWRPAWPLVASAVALFVVATFTVVLPAVPAWVTLLLVAAMLATGLAAQVAATAYRPVTVEEYQGLRERELSHFSPGPLQGDRLLVSRCRRGAWSFRRAPLGLGPAVHLWDGVPELGVLTVNVPPDRRRHLVLVDGADLPARHLVRVRDSDGALAVLADVPARDAGPVSSS